MADEVRLVMPAGPEFLRVARVTATGMAARLAFTIDEIDDLRIGIDELVFGLIGTRGRPGTLVIHYFLMPRALEIRGTGAFEDPGPTPGLTTLAELVLAVVADEHDITLDSSAPAFRLLKRCTLVA